VATSGRDGCDDGRSNKRESRSVVLSRPCRRRARYTASTIIAGVRRGSGTRVVIDRGARGLHLGPSSFPSRSGRRTLSVTITHFAILGDAVSFFFVTSARGPEILRAANRRRPPAVIERIVFSAVDRPLHAAAVRAIDQLERSGLEPSPVL